jgi:ElaB/YqjD/DUF883 family membrane-anchored ribosome-binding protein
MAEDTETTQNNVAALAGQAKQQAQQVGGQVVGIAQKQVRTALTGQKNRAATAISDAAKLIRQAGVQAQGGQGSLPLADQLADRVGGLAQTIEQKEVEELIADTEDFARRQPALFLGIAATLGFVAVRVLKSGQAAAA